MEKLHLGKNKVSGLAKGTAMSVLFYLLFGFIPIIAQKNFTLDRSLPGTRMLGITLKDSLLDFDVSNMSVDGYEIENAIYYQENEGVTLLLKENVIDASYNAEITVLSFDREQGYLEISVPMDYIWPLGAVIADTSFGGFSQKILNASELEYLGGYKKWALQTEPAGFLDIVEQCDISFKSQPRIQLFPMDYFWEGAVVGESTLPEGPRWVEGHLKTHARNVSFVMRPNLEGRLKIQDGQILLSEYSLTGAFEARALLSVETNKYGKFNHEMELPLNIRHALPLDSGLVLTISENLKMNFNVESFEQGFRSESELKILGEFQLDVNLDATGNWVTSNHQLNITPLNLESEFSPENIFARGKFNVSLTPSLASSWFGEMGVDFNPSAISSMVQDSSGTQGLNRQLNYALDFKARGNSLLAGKNYEKTTFEVALLERQILSPPTSLNGIETSFLAQDSAVLSWIPGSDAGRFIVQKNTSGVWSDVDTVFSPAFSAGGLLPNSPYQFRVLPMNRFGIGAPVEMHFRTLPVNRPPQLPHVAYPVLNDTIRQTSVELSWESSDPDVNDVLKYTVYLDTAADPITKILENNPDKTINYADLIPGKKYFIKIVVTDGMYLVTSPVWSFYSAPVEKPKIIEAKSKEYPHSILIPEGKFQREDGNVVRIHSFFLQKFEVIQKDFKQSQGFNPSYWKGDSLPVENVNWDQAIKYCQDVGGRLPTEAEWEYAARGGSRSEFFWGQNKIEDYAWYYANSEKRSHKVGQKKPNGFGLYDMSGNVFEWVMDWYGEYSSQQIENPVGIVSGTKRVTRGGSWYSDAGSLKSSSRFMNRPGFASFKLGFRCAFDVD